MIVCGLILAVVTISILYILIRHRWPDDLRAAAKVQPWAHFRARPQAQERK